jgi:hypothetical protein
MKYVDQSEIYKSSTEGLDIFKYYFPNYDYGSSKAFLKVRDIEKTASARITYFNGLWRITDFGNQGEINSLPAISFVRWRENMQFIDAVNFINDVILSKKISASQFVKPQYSAEYSHREVTPEDHKGEYHFTYKETPSENDLQSIGRYVTPELLKKYNCRVVEQYEFVGKSKAQPGDIVHIFKSTPTYPIYVFDYGKFKKIYKPLDPEKRYRFLYVGTKPKDYVYGLKQILSSERAFKSQDVNAINPYTPPKEKPEAIAVDIFRCSGESDALNLASLGLHVYWLNSETASLDFDTWKEIDDLCQNHYQVMDLDETGRNEAYKFALKNISLFTLYLPEWIKYRMDWRGNPCKDAKDFINLSGKDKQETKDNFDVLCRRAIPMKFWHKAIDDKTGKVTYNLNLEYYYHFLNAHGFRVMDSKYHRKASYCYARITGKVVELIHPDEIKKIIKRFTKDWIREKNLLDEIALLNKINTSNQINEMNLQELPSFNPNFKNHSKDAEYIHFNNGSLKITRDKIERIKHEQVPNFILGKLEINDKLISHYIPRKAFLTEKPLIEINPSKEYNELLERLDSAKTTEERENINFKLAQFAELDKYTLKINDPDFIFIRFLKDLSQIYWRDELEQKIELSDDQKKEQDLLFINLLFNLGWQISLYKDPGRPWLTFLQDMKISQVGKSSGRSGKSLYSAAITHVRPSFYIGGRRQDITQKTEFIYDGYTRFHNNIEVDDLYEYADFNFFYTQVTGKREVNSKFISKQILDYSESGKMLISSNFELANTDSSTLARILNAGVSDYYHERTKYNDYKETRTPLTKFGKRLYDDFTDEEWNKFYNICAYAIQLSMRFFKIQPPMSNLEKRQLRREMTKGLTRDEEFWIWANTWFTYPTEKDTDENCPIDKGGGLYNKYNFKDATFQSFIDTLPKATSAKYKATQFKKSLAAYCDYWGFEFNPKDKCTGDTTTDARRGIRKLEGVAKEAFYISTAPKRDSTAFHAIDGPMNSIGTVHEPDPEPETEMPF